MVRWVLRGIVFVLVVSCVLVPSSTSRAAPADRPDGQVQAALVGVCLASIPTAAACGIITAALAITGYYIFKNSTVLANPPANSVPGRVKYRFENDQLTAEQLAAADRIGAAADAGTAIDTRSADFQTLWGVAQDAYADVFPDGLITMTIDGYAASGYASAGGVTGAVAHIARCPDCVGDRQGVVRQQYPYPYAPNVAVGQLVMDIVRDDGYYVGSYTAPTHGGGGYWWSAPVTMGTPPYMVWSGDLKTYGYYLIVTASENGSAGGWSMILTDFYGDGASATPYKSVGAGLVSFPTDVPNYDRLGAGVTGVAIGQPSSNNDVVGVTPETVGTGAQDWVNTRTSSDPVVETGTGGNSGSEGAWTEANVAAALSSLAEINDAANSSRVANEAAAAALTGTGVVAADDSLLGRVRGIYDAVVGIPAALTGIVTAISAVPAAIADAIESRFTEWFVPTIDANAYSQILGGIAEGKFPFSAVAWVQNQVASWFTVTSADIVVLFPEMHINGRTWPATEWRIVPGEVGVKTRELSRLVFGFLGVYTFVGLSRLMLFGGRA